MNCEIFEHWYEYFLIIYWGFFRPNNEKLNGKIIPKEQYLLKDSEKIRSIFNNNNPKFEELQKAIDDKYNEEEDRKKTIENKAHILIGQTNVAVTLMLGSSTIILPLAKDSLTIQIIIGLLLFLIIINLITVGLSARNALVLLDGYWSIGIKEQLQDQYTKLEFFFDKYYCIYRNNYLNNVKATYLKFSHWYFKISIILILVVSLFLSTFIIFRSTQLYKNDFSNKNIINYENCKFGNGYLKDSSKSGNSMKTNK